MSIVDSETIRAVPAFGILFTEGIHSGYNQKKRKGIISMETKDKRNLQLFRKRTVKMDVLACRWMENVKLKVKESSYVKYHNLVYNHLIPELGDRPSGKLTTAYVEEFVQKKLESGRKNGKGGLSEKTVRDMLAVLKEICIYTAGCGIEIPCRFELIKVRSCKIETTVLNRQTQQALEQFLLQDNSLTKTGILLSLYMGLRLGEVCALKRGHILYAEQILHVRGTMQRIQNIGKEGHSKTRVVVTEPKSSSSLRDIPIPDFLMERLEQIRNMPDNAYLLTGSTETFIEPRTMENILRRYLQECGIQKINYHALRHTFATRYVESGFDAKSLSEILGHSSVNITLDRYVHSSMEQKRRNMEKAAGLTLL